MSTNSIETQHQYYLNAPGLNLNTNDPLQVYDPNLSGNGKLSSDEIEDWFRKATDQQYQMGINQPLGVDKRGYVNPFFEQAKKYGPPPQHNPNYTDTDLNSLVNKYFKKSTFEEIIETIFTTSEKEQFLLDVGYLLEWDNSDGSYDIYRMSPTKEKVRVSETFDKIFLKEISIKFKNLLLSKSTLKLKL